MQNRDESSDLEVLIKFRSIINKNSKSLSRFCYCGAGGLLTLDLTLDYFSNSADVSHYIYPGIFFATGVAIRGVGKLISSFIDREIQKDQEYHNKTPRLL